jgi:hypothetical protein
LTSVPEQRLAGRGELSRRQTNDHPSGAKVTLALVVAGSEDHEAELLEAGSIPPVVKMPHTERKYAGAALKHGLSGSLRSFPTCPETSVSTPIGCGFVGTWCVRDQSLRCG